MFTLACLALSACLVVDSPDDARIGTLLAQLEGSDEPARSLARQLLPREGVAVVPRVVPLLGRDNASISQAAYQVLSDIAHDASAPGHEADRRAVTEQLLGLVAKSQSRSVRLMGLRLLPIVAPEGVDLGPVAALLGDPELREKARVALEEMGTTEARAALRKRLGETDPVFAIALLNALGRLGDKPSLATMRTLAGHAYPGVRSAAARALANVGEPADLALARSVVERSDPATRREAVDAQLRLANRLASDPTARGAVVALFRDMLKSSREAEKTAALAGLGRVGDSSCVTPIVEAIRGANPTIARVGIAALGSIPGEDTTSSLLGVVNALPPAEQSALIPALGSRRSAAVIPTLAAQARSTDPPKRRAALDALAASARPEALAVLLEVGSTSLENRDERSDAVVRLLTLARSLEAQGSPEPAGRAYAAAFRATLPGEVANRLRALDGIGRCPVPDAAVAVREAARDATLREPALRALLAVARRLSQASQNPEAIELYRVARSLNPTGETLRALVDGLDTAGARDEVRGLLGTIPRWWVIGPFDLGEKNEGWTRTLVDEPSVSVVARYMAGKRRVGWTPVVSKDLQGRINLLATVGQREHAIAYAYAEVVVDQATDALLLVGSDDSSRVWVNGKMAFEAFQSRGLTPDADRIPVHLQAGKNTILIKVYQDVLGWELCARLVHPDGRAIAFTQPME